MKTFCATLSVFALLLVLITVNACYIQRITDKMEAVLSHAELIDADKALEELESVWEKHRDRFSLSVSQEEMRELDRQIICMRVALLSGAETDFRSAKALAIESIRQMRQPEQLTLLNLL